MRARRIGSVGLVLSFLGSTACPGDPEVVDPCVQAMCGVVDETDCGRCGAEQACNPDHVCVERDWAQSAVTTLPHSRTSVAMAYDEVRGQIVLFGGMVSSGALDETWLWDGTRWNRAYPNSSPPARRSAVLVPEPNLGGLLLFGGYSATSVFFTDTWLWDGSDWSELSPTTSPPAQWSPSATWTGSKVLTCGGSTPDNSAAGRWEWQNGNWYRNTDPNNPDIGLTGLATFADGTTVMYGGWLAGETDLTWRLENDSWANLLGLAPRARYFHKLAYSPLDDRVVLFGGQFEQGTFFDTWVLDAGLVWTDLPTRGPQPRVGHGLAADATGQAVLFGGSNSTRAFDDTWRLENDEWVLLPSQDPGLRVWPTLTWDEDRAAVVLFGGWRSQPDGTTWRWTGTAWELIESASDPPARWAASMTHDPVGGGLVLFGGINPTGGASFGDTWRLEPNGWTELQPATSPPPGRRGILVTALDRQEVWLFGGEDEDVPQNGLWRWDGTTWSEITTSNRPPALSLRTGAYDQHRQRLVTFGGNDAVGITQDQLWEFDGIDWQLVPQHSPKPSARIAATMVYDPARRVVRLSGGSLNDQTLGDSWEWDGESWSQSTLTGGPPAVWGFSAAFDAGLRCQISFGGQGDSGASGDTWSLCPR